LITKQPGSGQRAIKTLFSVGTVGSLTDGELLGLFITRHGEAAEMAFSVLVERHGPMVLRVCRSILRDEHDSEDAFQATFLVLVDRAGTVRDRTSVGSWLHGVALRVAACARGSLIRRRAAERRAADCAATDSTPEMPEPDLAPILHEELARLPERYRLPMVLCYLEGRACEDVADRLGWPVGTVKSRLARGRERLRSRLIGRGFAPCAIPLNSMLSGKIARAEIMSTDIVASTVRMAVRFASGGLLAGVVPVGVGFLTEGVLKAMDWSRLRVIAQGALLAVVVGACVGSVAQVATKNGSTQSTARALEKAPAPVPNAEAQTRTPETASPERLLLRCRELIDKMPASFRKARFYSELATTQANLHFRRDARETGRRGMQTAGTMDRQSAELGTPSLFDQVRSNELREAAKALAVAGDVEGALAAEETIGTASPQARGTREYVLQEVGTALVKAGFLEEANRVMTVMRGRGLNTDHVLWEMASAQARAGNDRAAVQTADSIPDQVFRVAALVGVGFDCSTYYMAPEGGIALAQFHSGNRTGAEATLRKALAVAEGLADAKSKGRCLSMITRTMLAMGDLAGALRLVGTITDAAGYDRAQVDIAIAHAEAQRWEDAMKAVESIREGAPRLVALCRVGVARCKAKDREAAQKLFSRALEIAKDLKLNGEPDPTGPYHVAVAQAESGDFRGARETMRHHQFYPSQEEETELIAMMQVRAGELSGALLTLQELSSDDARSRILREIVKLQIRSSEDQAGIDSVDGYDSPVCAARVLMGIAEGLAGRKRAGANVDGN
jgi:RNA polymerase sigma factor (sigma-70 family)